MRQKCEIYSRVCGYLRPTARWNEGKMLNIKIEKFSNLNCNILVC